MPIASYPSPTTSPSIEPTLNSGHYFCPIGPFGHDRNLFTVTPGITAREGAQIICELLDALNEPIYATAMSERSFSSRNTWLTKYTLDAARAVARAVAMSLEQSVTTSETDLA